MMKKLSDLLLVAGSALLVGLASCIPQQPPVLSETVDVTDFTVATEQRSTFTDDVTINASGSVDIAGVLTPESDDGQSITIKAVGDVTISGMLASGNGPTGTAGGDVTIISLNGNIIITDSTSIAAGNGGSGQTTTSDATLTDLDGAPFTGRMITGGAGASGGSLTLQAPNGDIAIALAPGMLHLGNGGNGLTIEVQGQDLLITETPEQLENAGGNSGIFTVEALTLNGTPLDPNADLPLDLDLIFSGGAGGAAGDYIFGMDADGNSTWPEPTAEQQTARNKSDARSKKIYTDLLLTGASGGDGYLSTGSGGSLRRTGRSAASSGDDGQNVKLNGGRGGNALSPACLEGGNGGQATATGGDGARGTHPTGTGGDGGKGDATGGPGGVGSLNNGRHGDGRAYGGNGGKGGGACPNNVAHQGGRGGFGGGAYGDGGNQTGVAVGGNGGDGGDGRDITGVVGSPLLAIAFGGASKTETQGKKGNPGKTCPPVQALSLSVLSDVPLPGGTYIRLSCIQGAEVAPAEEGCGCEHVHGAITIPGVSGGPFPDPYPEGCGHGCVVTVQESDLDHDCK